MGRVWEVSGRTPLPMIRFRGCRGRASSRGEVKKRVLLNRRIPLPRERPSRLVTPLRQEGLSSRVIPLRRGRQLSQADPLSPGHQLRLVTHLRTPPTKVQRATKVQILFRARPEGQLRVEILSTRGYLLLQLATRLLPGFPTLPTTPLTLGLLLRLETPLSPEEVSLTRMTLSNRATGASSRVLTLSRTPPIRAVRAAILSSSRVATECRGCHNPVCSRRQTKAKWPKSRQHKRLNQ